MMNIDMKRYFAHAIALFAAIWLAAAGSAQPVRIGSSGHGKRVSLTVNYQPVVTLARRGDSSASERANTALSRLSGLVKSGRPVHFEAGRGPGGWAVLANGGVVVVAGSTDAKAAGVKRKTLAHRWASSFARAWNLPLLQLSSDNVIVPVGSSRQIRLGGVGRGPVRIAQGSECPASAKSVHGAVILHGLRPGRGTVTVSRDGVTLSADYRVMKWAGSVRTVTLEVTGSTVPRELIQTLIHSEAYRGIRLEPGAWSSMENGSSLPSVWSHGRTLHASVGVRMGGSGYLPVQTRIPLLVVRRQLPTQHHTDLFYSNRPETLVGPRVLFRHSLTPGTPARLLFHHQNTSERALTLAVDLHNEGSGPAKVQVIDGIPDPAVDPVLVGHQAAYKFFKRTRTGSGIIIELPAHGVRRLSATRFRTGETASGLLMVRPLGKGALSLTTVAESISGGEPTAQGKEDRNPVFSSPDIAVSASYAVGGSWTYVPIGQKPVSNAAGLTLDGNYGVLYTVHLRVENPTATRRTVRVYFEPRAGEARAVMVINGVLSETGRAVPPAELEVARVTLSPHQSKTLTLVTMPAAGSSYPAALIVHA